MKQGVLVYDMRTERMDIRFGLKDLLWWFTLQHLYGVRCR